MIREIDYSDELSQPYGLEVVSLHDWHAPSEPLWMKKEHFSSGNCNDKAWTHTLKVQLEVLHYRLLRSYV